jgi:predicted ATPase
LCLLDQQQALAPGQVAEYVRSFPYNEVVLLMPPWEAIYRTDSERDQTFAEAVEVFEGLRRWYARWGTKPLKCLVRPLTNRSLSSYKRSKMP